MVLGWASMEHKLMRSSISYIEGLIEIPYPTMVFLKLNQVPMEVQSFGQ